jgi:hypothetical protein
VRTWNRIFWTVAAIVLLWEMRDFNSPQRIGHAVACSAAFPFRDQQAQILAYGLQDVRGLACAGSTPYFAEGGRPLIAWRPESSGMNDSERDAMCPEESCGDADQRGVAISGGALYVAEHSRARIAVQNIPRGSKGASKLDTHAPSAFASGLTGPSTGVAAAGDTLFITDDRPWPAYQGGLTAGKSGGLYTCRGPGCTPALIDGALQHPSGVAAVGPNGPIFVAENLGRAVRWRSYGCGNGVCAQTGALGSARWSGEPAASFLGVATDGSRVFAAGPGGLYVLAVDGTVQGRVMFDEPVSGVATDGKSVYLAVGHNLCRLRIRTR